MIKHSTYHSRQSGFSLLELSVVLGIIALVVGMSLTVGEPQVKQEKIRNSWNELQVIKKSLALFGERYGRLPCPAPLNAAQNSATYGLSPSVADCDATPPAGITHVAAPAMKYGAVPFKTLGLNEAMIADDWDNRYIYAVDNTSITAFDPDSNGVLTVNDRGGNPITTEAAFVVFSTGETGRGGTDHDNLTTSACTAGFLDTANCATATVGTYIDSSIRETDANNTFYDDMLVWGKASNIFNETALINPDDPPVTGCIVGAGMTIDGAATGDRSGNDVSSVGDVNGDGYADFVIAANAAAPNGTSSGATHLIFGKPDSWTTDLDLSSLDGNNGVTLNGVSANDGSAIAVSGAGDVNGDGYDDILIGANLIDPNGANSGGAYLVFGKGSAWASTLELSTLNGTTGVLLSGAIGNDRTGTSVSTAGDVNGDGFDDFIIASTNAPSGNNRGAVYVVFGKVNGWTAQLDLVDLDGTNGAIVKGLNLGDSIGTDVASAGDINNDGYDDFLIGASNMSPNGAGSGQTFLIFGKPSGWEIALELDTSSLDGVTGMVFNGISANDNSGYTVASAGDVNNDDYDDFIIGAPAASPNGTDSGAIYLIFGKASGWTSSFELSSLNGSNGVTFNGITTNANSGRGNFSAGDVNGDGYNDLIISAFAASPNGAESGQSYIVFGKASGWSSDFELSTLNGSNGVAFNGISANDNSGISTSSAGDVNNDGYDDFIIGALNASGVKASNGQSYLLFGNSNWSSTGGTIELSALEDPTECTSNACPLEVQLDLDSSAEETSWSVRNSDNKTLIAGSYTAADDNSTIARSYVLPRGTHSYDITLTDQAGDGFASVSDHFGLRGFGSAGTAEKFGPDSFQMCVKSFTTDTSCGFSTDDGTSDMLCGGHCGPITGITINGIAAGDGSGASVSSAGDVNGDGYNDLIIGANGANSLTGQAYVIFGDASGFSADIELSSLDGTNGFLLNGVAAADQFGGSVSSAGDFNGDGYDDIIIGAHKNHARGVSDSGAVYLIYGKASGFAASLNVSTLNGTNGAVIHGVDTNAQTGLSVSSAGDFNGDGYDDVIVGSPGTTPGTMFFAGTTHIIFGSSTPTIHDTDIQDIQATLGFAINGAATNDQVGLGVSSTGDINRDGYDDIIIGAHQAGTTGSAYVIFGYNTASYSTIELAALSTGLGFVMNGIDAGDKFGSAVSSAGDVNGDGFDDFIIGAPHSNSSGSESGKSYVVFGKASGWGISFDISSLDGTNGFILNGVNTPDNSGATISSAGDVNNDGFDDFIIGAPRSNSNGVNSGKSHIIFGKASGWSASFELSSLDGTNGFTLNGIDAGDGTGSSVSSARDVNGDGYADVIIGAFGSSPNGLTSGKSYLIFGSPESFSATHELSTLAIPTALCTGCSPACNSGCNGDDYEIKACQAGTCTITNTVTDSPKCAAVIPPETSTDCTRIDAGVEHTCGLGDNGKAYCWGNNNNAQLGEGGEHLLSNEPVEVHAGESSGEFIQISSDSEHTCAIGTDNKAYCWGDGTAGKLGHGVITEEVEPVEVHAGESPGTFTQISSGQFHTCAIGTDNNAYCWGSELNGKLGNGIDGGAEHTEPVEVHGGESPGTFTQISAAESHTCAIGIDDKAYCWGSGGSGKLGNGSTSLSDSVPLEVHAGESPGTFTQISAEDSHTCAIGTDNKAYCWGDGGTGKLGNGSTTDQSEPVEVHAGESLATFTQISAGDSHTCAIGTDNKAYCWGDGGSGRLGNGLTTDQSEPVEVHAGESLATFTQISSGYPHTCAIGADNKAYCWGEPANGILGAGTISVDQLTPIEVHVGEGYTPATSCNVGFTAPPTTTCEIICSGTDRPSSGAVCTDGSIFAGHSPDGNVCMYTTPADQPSIFLTDGRYMNNPALVGANSDIDGDGNSAAIEASPSSHIRDVAVVCNALTDHTKNDWYLPAFNELEVLITNRADIGNFTENRDYWSSTEANAISAKSINTGLLIGGTDLTKTVSTASRCVRKDSSSGPPPDTACDVFDHYNMDDDAHQYSWKINQGATTIHSKSYDSSYDNDISSEGPYTITAEKNYTFTLTDSGGNGFDSNPDFIALLSSSGALSLADILATRTGTANFSSCTVDFSVDSSCAPINTDINCVVGGPTFSLPEVNGKRIYHSYSSGNPPSGELTADQFCVQNGYTERDHSGASSFSTTWNPEWNDLQQWDGSSWVTINSSGQGGPNALAWGVLTCQ